MKKVFISLLTIIVVVVVGNYYYQNNKSKNLATWREANQPKIESEKSVQNIPKQEIATTTASIIKYYTMAEVAAHGADPDSEECWTVIHDKVYDILEFAENSHPGGEMIFDACGKDATKLFETRPMGSKTPHSAEARKILEKYYIGNLKK